MGYKENYDMGEQYYINEEYENALRYFEIASSFEQTNDCMNYIGCCHMKMGHIKHAKKIFAQLTQKVIWQRPWFNLGQVYLMEKDFAKAKEHFDKALKISPNDESCHFYMGVYYEKIGQFAKAIEYYKKSVKYADDVEDTLYTHINIGLCYKALEQYDIAMRCFCTAREIDPQCYEAIYDQAIIFMIQKQYQRALELLRQIEIIGKADKEIQSDIQHCINKLNEAAQGDGSVVR